MVVKEIFKVFNVYVLELNIFCLNVKIGGIVFGINFEIVVDLMKWVKEVFEVFVYVKLLLNVVNIVEIVKVIENVGVDGLMMINILFGMCLDLKIVKLILVNCIGGLLGFVIKLVVICMVYEVS